MRAEMKKNMNQNKFEVAKSTKKIVQNTVWLLQQPDGKTRLMNPKVLQSDP